ncbi:hypothetical protein Tsubulata_028317 [Turnera subulata]|uniref:LisH domain-containing protein n=1 Tax=Turnera subulata TaxID=218843 RepID=A0A9Q0FMT1_9ROSI|nr:hypothetical protein Tsubulata_028317 [Turnera subulata]
MGSSNDFPWDAQKMFDLYLHDYMVKRNMHSTAAIFSQEANVSARPVVIDPPDGFLREWWSFFYDTYFTGQPMHQGVGAEGSSVQTEQTAQNVGQNFRPLVPKVPVHQQQLGQFLDGANLDRLMGQSARRMQAARTLEEGQNPRHLATNFNPNLLQLDANQLNFLRLSGAANSRRLRILPFMKHRETYSLELDILLLAPNLLPQYPSSTEQCKLPSESSRHRQYIVSANSANSQNQDLISAMITSEEKNSKVQTVEYRIRYRITLSNPESQTMVQLHYQQKESEVFRRRSRKSNFGRACLDAEVADENVESFFSSNDDNIDDKGVYFSSLIGRGRNDRKEFNFQEFCCLRPNKSKVLCCNFSSDGKILATGGHEKKVAIWNMETLGVTKPSDGHSLLITDVRFRRSSTIFATSSFDRTVKIWDAANQFVYLSGFNSQVVSCCLPNNASTYIVMQPSKSLISFSGHSEQVMSLDFHPRKVDLLCSCDTNDEIRLWNVKKSTCVRVSQGGIKQVRFQPQCGKLLATATGNNINVIDVEIGDIQFNLKGHTKDVLSICWDASGKFIASVSEDSARVWSAVDGSCIHALHSNGNKFRSCTFHPGYSQLLIIGGYQVLELWNPTEGNKTISVSAHNGLIAALADSLETEMVASASHDQCVKLWH